MHHHDEKSQKHIKVQAEDRLNLQNCSGPEDARSFSGIDRLRTLPPCLFQCVWPSGHVMIGITVSKWMREELLSNQHALSLTTTKVRSIHLRWIQKLENSLGAGSGKSHNKEDASFTPEEETLESVHFSASSVCRTLLLFKHNKLLLSSNLESNSTRSRPYLPNPQNTFLQGLNKATTLDFGAGLVSLQLKKTWDRSFRVSRANFSRLHERRQFLRRILQAAPNLQALNLAHNYLNSDDAAAIATALSNSTALSHLNLSDNLFDTQGLQHLTPLLSSLRLSSLQLARLRASHDLHLPFLADPPPPRPSQPDTCVTTLVESVTHSCHLTLLDLSDTAHFPDNLSATALARALHCWPGLTKLYLGHTRLCDAALSALAAALPACPAVTCLSLPANNLGRPSALSLATAFPALSSLHTLDLARNLIGPDGARALAAAVSGHPGVRFVDLRRNGLGSAGVGRVSRVLWEGGVDVTLVTVRYDIS